MNGIIFFICPTSAISALLAALRGLRQCSLAGEVRFPFSSTRSYPCDGGSPSRVVAAVVLCASQGQFPSPVCPPWFDAPVCNETRQSLLGVSVSDLAGVLWSGHHFTADCIIAPLSGKIGVAQRRVGEARSLLEELGWFCSHGEQASPSDLPDNPPHHIEGVTISEAALRLSSFHPPSWEELEEGLRPGRRAIEPDPTSFLLAEARSREFGENVLMPSLPVEKRALLRSQSGPFSSTPFVAFPTTKATTFAPQPFRVLMLTVQLAQWQGFLGEGCSHLRVQPRVCAGRQAPVCERTWWSVIWIYGHHIAFTTADWRLWPTGSHCTEEHNSPLTRLWCQPWLATGQPVLEQTGTMAWPLLRPGDGKSAHTQNCLVKVAEPGSLSSPRRSVGDGPTRRALFLGSLARAEARSAPLLLRHSVRAAGFTGGDVSSHALLLAVSPCPCSTLPHLGLTVSFPPCRMCWARAGIFCSCRNKTDNPSFFAQKKNIWLHPQIRWNSLLGRNRQTGREEIRDLTKRRVLKWSSKVKTSPVDGWQRGETCRNRGESGVMGILWIRILERSRGWSNR